MIPDIKKILYATDLSENARYAFGYAVNLANRHDAKITVLHVVEELSSFAQSMVADMMGEKRLADIKTEKEKEVILELKIRLEEFCDNVRHEQPSCPFVVDNTIVVTGHPVDQIVHQAEEMDADLIVIGSHGRGGLADVTLGSTSRRVLRRCAMPVLVVRLHKNGTR
jgi:nucleotide-binding universal stress UspA family protein